MTTNVNLFPRTLSWKTIFLACLLITGGFSNAAPPDLTAGGVPNEDPPITFNLGPTGLRGWIYHKRDKSAESRQILVTSVEDGSPASGLIKEGDVILGANGRGKSPTGFTDDARKSFGLAVTDAEERKNATLQVRIWRAGKTSTVTLTLETLGKYSDTAPYNCPKSALVLKKGLEYVYEKEGEGRYAFGGLTLLATGNPKHLAKVRTIAHKSIRSPEELKILRSDRLDLEAKGPWERGHRLIFLAEYFLATKDRAVLPTIEAYAINIAKNRSMFGTMGHLYADRNADGSYHGPLGGGYGAVNSAGLPCIVGLVLAKECGISNSLVDSSIEAGNNFYSFYVDKGAIPYGEHGPWLKDYESNGKSGLAAILYQLQEDRVEEQKFFAMMATAAGNERDKGHTGPFFNFLWSPLGAAMGGEKAAAAHFREITWMLDLNRRWDWKFQYDSIYGEGPNNGETYKHFQMSTATLLAYALPHRKLRITGKNQDRTRDLSSAQVKEAAAADKHSVDERTTAQLIEDLGNWSPKIRNLVIEELGKREVTSAQLALLRKQTKDKNLHRRLGAIGALGTVGSEPEAKLLAALLTDPSDKIRYAAAHSMSFLPRETSKTQVDTVLRAVVSTAKPVKPLIKNDPMQYTHGRICALLFHRGGGDFRRGFLYDGLEGINRNLLYPAVRAVAKTPNGGIRGSLSTVYRHIEQADVFELSGTILDTIAVRAPADRMSGGLVRDTGATLLQQYGIADAIRPTMDYIDEGIGQRRREAIDTLGKFGGGALDLELDHSLEKFLEPLLYDKSVINQAQGAFENIIRDSDPTPLTVLKSITSVSARPRVIPEGQCHTNLRVVSQDLAKGDSIYTWTVKSAPKNATVKFEHNGNAQAANTRVDLFGPAGNYTLKVTMSDSRQFTTVSDEITLRLQGNCEPLKVFILAGGWNMQGYGEISPRSQSGTLEAIVSAQPKKYGFLKSGSRWKTRNDVWVSFQRGNTRLSGPLGTGFGFNKNRIGPEVGFGHKVGDAFDEPVLLIKTAWDGSSLGHDFRPPRSGWPKGSPRKEGDAGFHYQKMIETVKKTLANLKSEFPSYRQDLGYEIAGFCWHQGSPDRKNSSYNANYKMNLANLIQDVRQDLQAPHLPFVVATAPMKGWSDKDKEGLSLVRAQLAMADRKQHPEFEGNVLAVDTRDFYQKTGDSPANHSDRWNRNAETFVKIGQACAEKLLSLQGVKVTPPPITYRPGLRFGVLPEHPNLFDPNPGDGTTIIVDLTNEIAKITKETTEVFTGEFYDADGIVSFTEDINGKTHIFINGESVLESTYGEGRQNTRTLELTPGWNQIEIRISSGSGKGTNSEPGLGFDPKGGTNWKKMADPGKASILRSIDRRVPLPIYDTWAKKRFEKNFTQKDFAANQDGDSIPNLMEFAFGMDPTTPGEQPISEMDGKNGVPELVQNEEESAFEFYFVRRDDHGQLGSLSYIVQFSSDMETFYDSRSEAIFVADSLEDPAYEIAKVPFPKNIINGEKPLYARVKVIVNQ